MARILEAVRAHENGTSVAAAPRNEARASAPALAVAAPAPEIPFIEVGGGKIDGSADVLAVAVPTGFLPHPAIAVKPAEPAPEIAFESVTETLLPADPTSRFAAELIAYHDP